MRRIAVFLVAAYLLLLMILTWPVVITCFFELEMLKDPPLSANELVKGLSLFIHPVYLIFIAVLLLCEIGLLLIPVKLERSRPVSRRTVFLPIIVSGFLIGVLLLGMLCAISEFIWKNKRAFDSDIPGWLALGVCVLIWMAWSVIFCKLSKGQEPKNIVLKQCKYLLQGSVIALLVAVPTHIVARCRDYCCAGISTFIGIAFGLAVLLISFGPGIYFLYAARWKKLHPSKQPEKSEQVDRPAP